MLVGKAVGAEELALLMPVLVMGPVTAMVRRRASRSRAAPEEGCGAGSGCLWFVGLLFASRARAVGGIDCEPLRERRRARKPAGPRLVRCDDDPDADVDAVTATGGED